MQVSTAIVRVNIHKEVTLTIVFFKDFGDSIRPLPNTVITRVNGPIVSAARKTSNIFPKLFIKSGKRHFVVSQKALFSSQSVIAFRSPKVRRKTKKQNSSKLTP
jgi:hypothetical protein